MRVFRNGPAGESTRKLTEVIEASRDPERARKTFHRLRGWVADCMTPGVRLISTATSSGLGDESAVLVLYDQHPAPTTYVVGIARTGLFTTAVALRTDVGAETANRSGIANLLGQAVDRLCNLPDAGRCADQGAVLERSAPFAAGEVPALLAPVDMPFVGDPAQPWMGTPPEEITNTRTDMDVLGCVHPALAGEYDGDRFRTDLVRTFVKVDSDLPAEFGLTQAVAALPKKTAGALLEELPPRDQRLPRPGLQRRHRGAGPACVRPGRPVVHGLAPEHPAPRRADGRVLRRVRPQRLRRVTAGLRVRAGCPDERRAVRGSHPSRTGATAAAAAVPQLIERHESPSGCNRCGR